MNYIEEVKRELDLILKMSGTEYEDLLDVYALLVFTVGEKCTNENIHDAWSVWQSNPASRHRSLVPFNQLTRGTQDLDIPYRDAVIKVAENI